MAYGGNDYLKLEGRYFSIYITPLEQQFGQDANWA